MSSHKTSAIFTVQHDEVFYLPIWIKYYKKHFKPEDMYIVAHNTTDLTKDILIKAEKDGINVEYVYTDEIFNHDWLNSIVHNKQNQLLEKYNYVVFTDCDEIISPSNQTLKEFLDNANLDAYRVNGWHIIENKMVRDGMWDKTLITSVPLTYVYGYHTSTPSFDNHPDLFLYHVHRINHKEAFDRNQRLAKEKWDSYAINHGHGTHNKIDELDQFNSWFYEGIDRSQDLSDHALSILNDII